MKRERAIWEDKVDLELSDIPKRRLKRIKQIIGETIETDRKQLLHEITQWVASPYTSAYYEEGISPRLWMRKLRTLKKPSS